jgi:hypothetical protein
MIDKPKRNAWSRIFPEFALAAWTWHPLTLFVVATIATTAAVAEQ